MQVKIRVDAMTIAIYMVRGDKHDVVEEFEFPPSSYDELVKVLEGVAAQYEVRPSFQHLANQAIEADPHGPEGVTHTMEQIQDWYHRRYVYPYASTCVTCGEVKAKHGPSHWCKMFAPPE